MSSLKFEERRALDSVEHRALLKSLSAFCKRDDENPNESSEEFLRRFYKHPQCDQVMVPEIVLILGIRGAGKSALFRYLQAVRQVHGANAAVSSASQKDLWAQGHGVGVNFPQPNVLSQFFAQNSTEESVQIFWLGRLLAALMKVPEIAPALKSAMGQLHSQLDNFGNNPSRWLKSISLKRAEAYGALDQVERSLKQDSRRLFVAYDSLDTLTPDIITSKRLIRQLLRQWLGFSNRYALLRGKIFLRVDLFKSSDLDFPDSSKLAGKSINLIWGKSQLYALLFKRMANLSEKWAEYLKSLCPALNLEEQGNLGLVPQNVGEQEQADIISVLVSENMGRTSKKGRTVKWIPNNLQDGNGVSVPRSIFSLFGNAAAHEMNEPKAKKPQQLLTPDDLRHGLGEASKARVSEIGEEMPWVEKACEILKGKRVPFKRHDCERYFTQLKLNDSVYPTSNPSELIDWLHNLGVLRLTKDGRIHMPDIYRLAFGVKRIGGVPLPK